MITTRILAIEDSEESRLAIRDQFDNPSPEHGDVTFEVVYCESTEEARSALATQSFDVCVVDLALPEKSGGIPAVENGRAMVSALREQTDCGLIVLTHEPASAEEHSSLVLGADIFLEKTKILEVSDRWPADQRVPTRIEVQRLLIYAVSLSTRVKERRAGHSSSGSNTTFSLAGAVFKFGSRKLSAGQEEVGLSIVEHDTLVAFLSAPDFLRSREELAQLALKVDSYGNDGDRKVDKAVSRLRQKIERWIEIESVRGTGYRLSGSIKKIIN